MILISMPDDSERQGLGAELVGPTESRSEPDVTVFTRDQLASLKKGDITTFPPGTTGVFEVFMTDPRIEDPENPKASELTAGGTTIKVTVGLGTTIEPLRGTSRFLYTQTLPVESPDYTLSGYKVATTDSPEADPEAGALGSTNPTALLTKFFGDRDTLVRALQQGAATSLGTSYRGDPEALRIDLGRVRDAYFLVGVAKPHTGSAAAPTPQPRGRS